MRYAHTPRGQPPRSEDMRSCAEGWQVPEALSLLGGPLLRLLQMRLQGRQGRARKGGDRRVVPLLGVCLAQCTPTGATSVTPVYLSGSLCHKVERALIRALLFALPPPGGVFAPGGRPCLRGCTLQTTDDWPHRCRKTRMPPHPTLSLGTDHAVPRGRAESFRCPGKRAPQAGDFFSAVGGS